MTEKRYTHEKWYNERKILDNGELFAIVDVYVQADKICERLNEQHEQLKNYKQFVSDLIDEKLKEYPYLTLTEKWDRNCKYYHSCRENHEKNVAYASRHMLLQELKKELEE